MCVCSKVVLDEVDKLFELQDERGGAASGDDGEGRGDRGETTTNSSHNVHSSTSFLGQVDEILAECGGSNSKSNGNSGSGSGGVVVPLRRGLFSATIGPMVRELASSFLVNNPVHISIGTENAGASSITQRLVYTSNEDGKLLAIRQIVQSGLKPPVLVFVQSKSRAQELLKELIYDGINVDIMTADRLAVTVPVLI